MEELARESITLLASASAKPRVDLAGPRLGSLGAIVIMLKSALGAGLLNFPWAFERAGGIHNAIAVELVGIIHLYLYIELKARQELSTIFLFDVFIGVLIDHNFPCQDF